MSEGMNDCMNVGMNELIKKVKIWEEVDILTVNSELGPGFTVFM
jgi:hypothetical protein